ncbi:MAG: hypothetical protein SH868_17025 [Bythopirellula sp.]|mgnify:CR=1 FL=1|nr:hypothetical protein [Bythopirellula sp.]
MLFYAKKKRSATSPNGSVYVAVLGVALIVAVIGVSSVHVARVETRQAVALDEMSRARLTAQSGVECVLAKIKSDLNWRDTYEHGVSNLIDYLSNPISVSGSSSVSFEFTLSDNDGDLSDDDQDAVIVHCVGTAGKARHVIEVLLQPTGEGLTCLSASLHAGGNIVYEGNVNTNQTVSSNGNIEPFGGGAAIIGNAQAVGSISGSISGTSQPGMNPPLEMPDTSSVFEYYIANGTPITYSQLPAGRIEQVVLSASNNPYGTQVVNPQGIYVIDCQGNQVTVRNSRIQATLVFLNANAGVQLSNSILWQPAIANFPALLVQGNVSMNWQHSIELSEPSLGINFNPSHTPYQSVSDADLTDRYPGLITGIVYMTGEWITDGQTKIQGTVVVGSNVDTALTVNLTYQSSFFMNAPPGFTAGTEMELAPGTWKQVAY